MGFEKNIFPPPDSSGEMPAEEAKFGQWCLNYFEFELE
jgi:hypothetical protein